MDNCGGMAVLRRKVRLVPTEKARPIIARGKHARAEFERLIKEGVTPEEFAVFTKCLETAGENARRMRAACYYQELRYEEPV